MKDKFLKEVFFPYDSTRKTQEDMIKSVKEVVESGKNLVMHAPTGIGKTAASLSPALAYAIKKNLTVFFLTARQTQHQIAIETLKKIKEAHNLRFTAIDIIGKRYMCGLEDVESLYAFDFIEFCRSQREDDKCEFYTNTKEKGKKTLKARKIIEDLEKQSPCHSEAITKICRNEKLCPYEIATIMAAKAPVIIADYNYIFNKNIRKAFFKRTNKELEKSIIIVDEAHNLGERIRNLLSKKLSNRMLEGAIKEAYKFGHEDAAESLTKIKTVLEEISKNLEFFQEKIVKKDEFMERLKEIKEFEVLHTELEFAAEDIREKKKRSFIGWVASFLENWIGPDEGFARILSKKQDKGLFLELSYKCLDPGLATDDVLQNAHSVICMSGTLTPTEMYRDTLGFSGCSEKEYESIFPEENRLNLIVPKTTTKFAQRSPEQYKKIAVISADLLNLIKGNSIIFFPSYQIRDDVYKYFFDKCDKTCFLEESKMTKEQRYEMIENFKKYKNAVILAVASGSFSQGVDMPGILKSVIVVGLPLERPNLETRELINYYDKKFNKGWDYGYVLPAITKVIQAAGRCIRSEKDRGIIIFLDERYAWPSYRRCFPNDIKMKISSDYGEDIKEFFGNK